MQAQNRAHGNGSLARAGRAVRGFRGTHGTDGWRNTASVRSRKRRGVKAQSDLNTQAVQISTSNRPPPIATQACAVASMVVSAVDLNAGHRGVAAAMGLGAVAVQGGLRTRCTALGNDIAGALFAATALRGHAQFKLDVVKAHASMHMLGNFAVGHFAANTNNHLTKPHTTGT